jgi:hypothetical protein
MEGNKDTQFDAISFINNHHVADNKNYMFEIIKNCVVKCVNKFDSTELSQNEENCIEKCYLSKFENFYISKI